MSVIPREGGRWLVPSSAHSGNMGTPWSNYSDFAFASAQCSASLHGQWLAGHGPGWESAS